jgi:DNA-directed RNA polymerase specialized sigma24 family protein
MPLFQRYSDRDSINMIKNGNENALIPLFQRNFMDVEYILEQKGKAKLAAPLLQDALIVLWEEAQNPDFSTTFDINKWILNKIETALNEAELTGSEPKVLKVANDENEEEKLVEIYNYMKYLPEICRSILFYTYFEKWNEKKISDKLETVRQKELIEKRYQCKRKFSQLIKRNFSLRNLI